MRSVSRLFWLLVRREGSSWTMFLVLRWFTLAIHAQTWSHGCKRENQYPLIPFWDCSNRSRVLFKPFKVEQLLELIEKAVATDAG